MDFLVGFQNYCMWLFISEKFLKFQAIFENTVILKEIIDFLHWYFDEMEFQTSEKIMK